MKSLEEVIDQYYDLSKSDAIKQENPVAIIALGEDGAGRDVVASFAKDELNHRGGSISIDQDFVNSADPHLEKSNHVISELISKASDDKYNLLINKNFDDSKELSELTKDLKSKGYEVDIRTIASPVEINKHKSLEEEVTNTLLFNKNSNKGKTQDVEGFLKAAEDSLDVNKIHIYDRVGNEVFNNERIENGKDWIKQDHPYNIFNFEKNKPLQRSEEEYLQLAQNELNALKASPIFSKLQMDLSKNNLKEREKILSLDQPNFIRESNNYKDIQHGIVVSESEKDFVLKINDHVGIRYEKSELDKNNESKSLELRRGQELYINNGAESSSILNEQEIQHFQMMNSQQDIENQVEHDHGR